VEQTKKVILIVEDDPSIRGGLVRAIQEDDLYQVFQVENGIVAMEWLSKNPAPALIITDFMMVGDGATIAQLARNMRVPIVMISAAPDIAQEALAKISIKIPIFPKPFDVFDMLSVVDTLTRTDAQVA
jgi:DNA-binding response OmpR family regulator